MSTETRYFTIIAAGRKIFLKVTLRESAVTRVKLSLVPDHDDAGPYDYCHTELAKKMQEIIDGKRDPRTIFCKICGTDYQMKVWEQTATISYGSTITYGKLSDSIGSGSPRSAGQALKANPVPIIIPCHRVLGRGYKIGGFSCGVDIKKLLLRHEYENSRGK